MNGVLLHNRLGGQVEHLDRTIGHPNGQKGLIRGPVLGGERRAHTNTGGIAGDASPQSLQQHPGR